MPQGWILMDYSRSVWSFVQTLSNKGATDVGAESNRYVLYSHFSFLLLVHSTATMPSGYRRKGC